MAHNAYQLRDSIRIESKGTSALWYRIVRIMNKVIIIRLQFHVPVDFVADINWDSVTVRKKR